MVLSTCLFDKPAFKNNIVNGLVLAGDGKKMSKRLKNYDDPMMVVNEICFHMRDACRSLGWEDGFVLIGHSLGSIIGVIYAAAFPEQVQDLILLDGYGPDNYEIFERYMNKARLQKPNTDGLSKPKGVVAERLKRHVQ